jgi:hypothetical protein
VAWHDHRDRPFANACRRPTSLESGGGGLMDKGAPTTVCRVPDDRVDRCHVWWGMMYS